MEVSSKVTNILAALKALYPDALCALHFGKDYELMIAVRLSAQCTDARVNLVTPALFAKYPTLEAFASADVGDVEEMVHSCGFYKHKARDMEDLLKLPGVGRKTATLLLGDIYHKEAYVCDTHCIRICGKLGLTHGKDPQKVEMQLRKVIPPEESSDFCHRIVLHGRAVCTARNPKCSQFTLAPFCDFFTGMQEEEA